MCLSEEEIIEINMIRTEFYGDYLQKLGYVLPKDTLIKQSRVRFGKDARDFKVIEKISEIPKGIMDAICLHNNEKVFLVFTERQNLIRGNKNYLNTVCYKDKKLIENIFQGEIGRINDVRVICIFPNECGY